MITITLSTIDDDPKYCKSVSVSIPEDSTVHEAVEAVTTCLGDGYNLANIVDAYRAEADRLEEVIMISSKSIESE